MEANTWLETLPSLCPINLFEVECDVPYIAFEKWQTLSSEANLPQTSFLFSQPSFADIAMGWNEEGIVFYAQVHKNFYKSYYPEIEKGDSLELMIDTRNMKHSSYNTRFCHHFFFLPQPVDGVQAGEKTHFRTADSHPLCDPAALKVLYKQEKKGYSMHICIPQSCLYGYDPSQIPTIGLNYRINRYHNFPQEFSVASREYMHYAQMPSLWGNVHLLPK